MRWRLATLIAFRQLAAQPHRLIGGWFGVGAAIVLLAAQLGIRSTLYESAVRLHRSLDADLVVISPLFVSLSNQPRFPIEYLYHAGATPGVAWARPLYAQAMYWRNPASGVTRIIYMFAFDPSRPVLTLDDVKRGADRLRSSGVILFDRLSRREFGPVARTFEDRGELQVGLALDQRTEDPPLRVEGLFAMGPTFVVDGNFIGSDITFHDLTNISLDRVTIGVLKLDPSLDPAAMRDQVAERLGPRVRVMTKPDFIALEMRYWANDTAIGFVFDLGLVIGFIVGVVFDYQLLYTLVHDNMTEYAVLKSLGHTDGFMRAVVLSAALAVGLGALLPFGAMALLVCEGAAAFTGLDVRLDGPQMVMVAGSAVVMCLLAAAIAMRRLRDNDPVELFG